MTFDRLVICHLMTCIIVLPMTMDFQSVQSLFFATMTIVSKTSQRKWRKIKLSVEEENWRNPSHLFSRKRDEEVLASKKYFTPTSERPTNPLFPPTAPPTSILPSNHELWHNPSHRSRVCHCISVKTGHSKHPICFN